MDQAWKDQGRSWQQQHPQDPEYPSQVQQISFDFSHAKANVQDDFSSSPPAVLKTHRSAHRTGIGSWLSKSRWVRPAIFTAVPTRKQVGNKIQRNRGFFPGWPYSCVPTYRHPVIFIPSTSPRVTGISSTILQNSKKLIKGTFNNLEIGFYILQCVYYNSS